MLQFSLDNGIESALLTEGEVSKDQLSRARRIQEQLAGQKSLSEVLLEMNWVSETRLEDFVRRHRSSISIGDIFVTRKLVTQQDVMTAREVQRKSGPKCKRLGEVLVEMGLIEERHVVEALAEKFSLPVLEPDISQIDIELVKRMSLKYLRRQIGLPICISDGILHLLVSDPTATPFIEEVTRTFNTRIKLHLATKAVILRALELVDSLLQGKDSGIGDYNKVKYHTLETQPQANDDRVVQMVDQLIRSAIEEGASDVHLEPMANKLRVRYRIDGVLVHKMDFPRDYTPRIISRVKILADADVAERRKHQDGRIFVKTEKQEIDIRASFYATVFGENVVLRILNKASLISLLELGFAPQILRLYCDDVLSSPSGITLVTGPTGSGKTTTLYSSIDHCNDPTVKIITCEDPVEYVIEGIWQ